MSIFNVHFLNGISNAILKIADLNRKSHINESIIRFFLTKPNIFFLFSLELSFFELLHKGNSMYGTPVKSAASS